MKHSTARLFSMSLAIILLFGSLVLFLQFVKPEYRLAQEQKGQNISKSNLLENQKATVEQVQEIVAAYKGNGTLQNVVSLALPQDKNEAEAVHQLDRLAAKHQLTVQSVNVQNPGARTTSRTPRGKTAEQTILKPVGVLLLQSRITGSYAGFRAFLSDLETNLRLMDVSNLTVVPVGKSSQDFYTFDITVATYYQTK